MSSVDKQLSSTQSALKDVNKLLKLDPKNTELLTQKQNLLQKSIQLTQERLKTLKTASEEAAKTAGNYDKWKAVYTPIQEEIVKTNQKLDVLKKNMKSMEQTGDVNTEGYKKAQTDVSELETKLESLKQQKKQVDEEFGRPISPEGMDALKREIQAAETELKNLERTAGSASATLAKISQSTGDFGKKAESLGNSLMPVTAGVTAVGAASVATANNFEDAMSQAAGALNKPMSQMEELRQLAIKTGQETIFSATEAGNAITELAKGGLTEADIKAGALQTTMDLAASSGMDLGSAANTVVQAMGAFGLEADKSAQAANALAGAAAASSTDVEPLTQGLAQCSAQAYNAGWSIQETTAVLGRFADAGITGSDAGTSLKTMLQRLAAPTDEAAAVIENLGIQTRDSGGNLLGASAIAEELQTKMGGLDSATRDAALQTIFGSDAMRAATIMMNTGSEGLAKYVQATNDQEAAQRLANSQMGEGSRAIEELKGTLETAGIIIGDTLAPIIKELAEFITELVNKFSQLPSGVQQAIIIFGLLLAAAGPLLIMIGKISTGISALTGFFSKTTVAGKAISGMLGILKTAFGTLFKVIMGHPVIAVITAIIAAIVLLYNKCEWFRDGVNAILKAVGDFFKNLGKNIISMKDGAIQAFEKMKSGISAKVTSISDTVKRGFQSAVDYITSLPGKAVQWGKDFIEGIASGIRNAIGKVTSAVRSVANKITSFLHFSRPDEGPLREYESWMPDFIDGLANGIDKNIYKITDAMKRAAGAFQTGELNPMVAPAQQDIIVNFSNTTQIGNREFDSYIVKTAQKGISGKQQNINACKGYAYV
uniref:Tail tape measure protein n=1 Tax=Siphoviridae sp. ctS3r5 TaxID=2826341 RepID=A0A8S5NBD4_9CAUD|nr:MAG TPA: tail tape measure protein [Siphoviridae sp. ctS3r5]